MLVKVNKAGDVATQSLYLFRQTQRDPNETIVDMQSEFWSYKTKVASIEQIICSQNNLMSTD